MKFFDKIDFQTLAILLLLVFISLFFFQPLETEDIWWHLKTGEWIVTHGQVPHRDVFSSRDQPVPAVSPQWLGSCIYYMIFKAGGIQGLKVFRSLIFLGVIVIFGLYARRKIPAAFWLIFTVVLVYGLAIRCQLRPFLFNFIFTQFLLMILFDYLHRGRSPRLIFIPLMGILWFNIHIGSVIYGLAVLCIFFFAQIIEWFNIQWAPHKTAGLTREILSRIKVLGLTLIAYVLGFFINPYGLEGFLYPFKVFLIPDFIMLYKLNAVIAELQPPVFLLNFSGAGFIIVFILTLVALIRKRDHKFTFVLLFLYAVFLFLRAVRAGGFFLLVAAYLLAETAREIDLQEKWDRFFASRETDGVIACCLIVFLCGGIIKIVNWHVIFNDRSVRYLNLKYATDNPAPALNFLMQHGLTGRIFNSSGYGGYIIWTAYPQLKPFVDNRQIDLKQYAKYRAVLQHPADYWPVAEKESGLRLALLDARHQASKKLVHYLFRNPDWRLIFVKGSGLIFVKEGAFRLPQELITLEEEWKSVKIAEADLRTLKTLASRKTSPLRSFWGLYPLYVESLDTGLTLFDLGFVGAGIKHMNRGLLSSDPTLARRVAFFVESSFAVQNDR